MPVNLAGRMAAASLVAAIALCAGSGHAENVQLIDLMPPVFEKQAVELTQLLDPPEGESEAPGTAPRAAAEGTPASANPDALAPDDSEVPDSTEFVFAGDLAKTLRKIDPDAKVDWDGKMLRIRANGQDFSVFPKGQEMVVNGNVEAKTPPLKFRNGEVYVPNEIVSRIGVELEKEVAPALTDLATTGLISPTPTVTPGLSPTPGATPEGSPTPASLFPDTAPPIATPTPRGAGTPIPVLPGGTPATTPVAPVGTPAAPVATPFPQATATPTPPPTPTPTPRPTPTPTPSSDEAEVSEAKKRNATLSTESFKAALRDRVSVSTEDIASFNMSQLETMAAAKAVTKIIIHPDESGLEREDQYGKESTRISLEIAQRLKNQLDAAGIESELTRDTEAAVTIGQSMEKISKSDAQVLIVVSVGYSTAFKDLGGYRVFYMNESVDYNSLRPRTFDASEVVPSELNYRPFQGASKVLASSVKNSISAALDREPVGTNPAPQYLIRRAPMAAAAVVVGYLSNPADAQRLTDTAQLDAMAKALAEGLQNFANQVSQGKIAGDESGGL